MTRVEVEIAADLAMLGGVEKGGTPCFRTWVCASHAAVVGIGQSPAREVDLDHCQAHGIQVVRRQSGGGAVVIGPGTLQYAFALPYSLDPALRAIVPAKDFCNRLIVAAIAEAGGPAAVARDESGDLRLANRKVGGVALRRRRLGMLLHGTLLLEADIAVIARVLRHPSREPAYRRGRGHADFLANLGPLDVSSLKRSIDRLLPELGSRGAHLA